MIKSIFVTRHEAAEFTHVLRHSFLGITLPPSEAIQLFSLQTCLVQCCEEKSSGLRDDSLCKRPFGDRLRVFIRKRGGAWCLVFDENHPKPSTLAYTPHSA